MELIEENSAPALQHTAALPILAYEEKINEMIASQHFTVIQGDTGCGKSSQVPQMILRDCRRRGFEPLILCTQPRRIAAISLAKRVSQEMGENLGRTVGYLIGADRVVGRNTSIRFVTTAWAFEKLVHNDTLLEEITHLVLDEVHERSVEADLLHLLIKMALPRIPEEKRPKVVLMSATFDTGVFAQYYCPRDPPKTLYVGLKRYSVETFYLETFSKCPALGGYSGDHVVIKNDNSRLGVGAAANTLFLQVCKEIHKYHLAREEPCCILVFLAGIAEIDVLWEALEDMEAHDGRVQKKEEDETLTAEDELADQLPKPTSNKSLSRFQLCMLHSSVDKEDQMVVFSDIPAGKTRIILSTDIAESSVTIPNARYVFDAGYHKHLSVDDRNGIVSLKTVRISQAAAKQRLGRTGRLFPGVLLRFYNEHDYEEMREYDEPDMLRLPLFQTVLRLKVAAESESGFVSALARPSEALTHAIDPPSKTQIVRAYTDLFQHGHMIAHSTGDLDDSIVTPLGKFVQKLGIDIRLGAIVVTALSFFPDYVPHSIVIAVSMSMQNVFVHPNPRTGLASFHGQEEFLRLTSKVEMSRRLFGGDMFSDMFTILRAFGDQPTRDAGVWMHNNGLHSVRMHHLYSQCAEIAHRLSPLVPSQVQGSLQCLLLRRHKFELQEIDRTILRFILLYSLSEQALIGKVKKEEKAALKGFDKKAIKDPLACVFFQSVPQEMIEMGGAFEKRLLGSLFKSSDFKIHVGKTQSWGMLSSDVAVEFTSKGQASFALQTFSAVFKNGKMNLWLSEEERGTLSAPKQATKISLKTINGGEGVGITGSSAVLSLEEEGTHLFIPGQAIRVGRKLLVEDLTWLSGNNPWVWKSLAICPPGRLGSDTGLPLVFALHDSAKFELDPEEKKKLVYLKHLCNAVVTSQFSPAGRVDIGAELCRSVLDINPAEVKPPSLKKAAKTVAPTKRADDGTKHAATVVVICSPAKPDKTAKVNVVEGLQLKSVLAVACVKVLEAKDVSAVNLRLEKSGKLIESDEMFLACLKEEADSMGTLRFEAQRRGEIRIPRARGVEEFVPGVQKLDTQVLGPPMLACAGPLLPDDEDDEWLLNLIKKILRMHADGRMSAAELVTTLKLSTTAPGRITFERVLDVSLSCEDIEFDVYRKVFAYVLEDGDSSSVSEFSFDSPASGKMGNFSFESPSANAPTFENMFAQLSLDKSPSSENVFQGTSKGSSSKKGKRKK